jgi:hypothetical protein
MRSTPQIAAWRRSSWTSPIRPVFGRAAGQLTRDHPDLNVLFNNDGIMLPVEAAGRIGAKLLSTPSPPT